MTGCHVHTAFSMPKLELVKRKPNPRNVTQHISRMNKRLDRHIAKMVTEKRGLKWSLTNWAYFNWGSTESAKCLKANIPLQVLFAGVEWMVDLVFKYKEGDRVFGVKPFYVSFIMIPCHRDISKNVLNPLFFHDIPHDPASSF